MKDESGNSNYSDSDLLKLQAEITLLKNRAEKAEANYQFMVQRAISEKLDGYRELAAKAATAENERDELRRQVKSLRGEIDECVLTIESLRAERNSLRERLRETAQILIGEVGSEDPVDAEEAARRTVMRISNLQDLLDQWARKSATYFQESFESKQLNEKLLKENKLATSLHLELNELFGWGNESMLHALLHVKNAILNLRTDLIISQQETKKLKDKYDRLQEKISRIESTNVDNWKQGYAAAEHQIIAWLNSKASLSTETDTVMIDYHFKWLTEIVEAMKRKDYLPINQNE